MIWDVQSQSNSLKKELKVVVNYFDNPEDAAETLKLIQAAGSEGIIVQGDMTKATDVKNLFDKAIEAFGNHIDALVNVVGGIVGLQISNRTRRNLV